MPPLKSKAMTATAARLVKTKNSNMDEIEIKKREERAEELFRMGYNCAQSVTGAWADYYGLDFGLAVKISASFGAGIGRMRETCGAACGMFLLAGLETGCTDPADREGKSANYKTVQFLAEKFREQNGYLRCADMLSQMKNKIVTKPGYQAEERSEEYYKKRPCIQTIRSASRIYGEYLMNKQQVDLFVKNKTKY